MTAYAYTRVSTERQKNSGHGVEGQKHAIEQYAKAHELEIAEWFSDPGVSGAEGLSKRPGLAAALSNLRKGDVLIVYQRSRIARDTLLGLVIADMVNRKGATIASCEGGVENDTTPTGKMVRTILDAVFEFQRECTRGQTRAAREAMMKGGRVIGGHVPYGYMKNGDKDRVIENPAEQAAILFARDLRAKNHSWAYVTARLNESEHKPRKRAKCWHVTQVKRMSQ